jgi:WD40 repeat protein
MQFCWSPAVNHLCTVVSEQGQLYTGALGSSLTSVRSHFSHQALVTCVAWSPDSSMLVAASEQQLHVYNPEQQAECFSAIVEVCGCLLMGCEVNSDCMSKTLNSKLSASVQLLRCVIVLSVVVSCAHHAWLGAVCLARLQCTLQRHSELFACL